VFIANAKPRQWAKLAWTADAEARIGRHDEGFESAYGMELLATVHWIAHEDRRAAEDATRAAELVQAWSPRKGRMFTAEHGATAWYALRDRGWLASPAIAPISD
jgi:hypothetical protein